MKKILFCRFIILSSRFDDLLRFHEGKRHRSLLFFFSILTLRQIAIVKKSNSILVCDEKSQFPSIRQNVKA